MKHDGTTLGEIVSKRCRELNTVTSTNGETVVYCMSRDQRVCDNHALLVAQQKALELRLPLVVVFNLSPSTGFRAWEHYAFMLDGLEQVAADLRKLGISFVMVAGSADETIPEWCDRLKPAHVYFDFNPLAGVRTTQQAVAKKLRVPCTVVDTHNVVPAWVASDKQEFAARTFRRKIHAHLQTYMVEPEQVQAHPYSATTKVVSLTFAEARHAIASVAPSGISHGFKSGEQAGRKLLVDFITHGLPTYATARNNIAVDGQSNLSPYLHFGQISSLRVALEVLYAARETPLLFVQARMASGSEPTNNVEGMNALFEEMLVRKELSDNFCMHTENVSTILAAPVWAQNSLTEHASDRRSYVYSREQLEQAQTHDEAWNAAQRQLTRTGKMHGYMRMYWAKKMLEWTPSPQTALDYAIYLNDHYAIDGGDPNGYVGVLWSIAGLHDRPWGERPIFGKVRYMNAAGLRRKFDINSYVLAWRA